MGKKKALGEKIYFPPPPHVRFLGAVCLLLAFTACDFNNSLIDFIADATNNARVAGDPAILPKSKLMSNGITAIPAGEITTITIPLRNPRNYDPLDIDWEGENTDNKASVEINTDSITVTITNPARGDIFDLNLSISYGERPMSEYKLPKMEARYFDKDLTSLSVTPPGGELTPAFSPDIVNYQVAVVSATTSVTVTTAASHPSADVKINGENSPADINITSGTTNITIQVTADNEDVKTYSLTVTRNKHAGAAVEVPTHREILTPTSFSINPLEFSPPPDPYNNQIIEYAISAGPPPDAGWIDYNPLENGGIIEFNSRAAGSTYYVHARSKANDDYAAGPVSTSGIIKYHSVTFNPNGGTPTPATQYVWDRDSATVPAGTDIPTKAFDPIAGLYLDPIPEYETLISWETSNLGVWSTYNFGLSVISNITLRAKWTETEPVLVNPTFAEAIARVNSDTANKYILLLGAQTTADPVTLNGNLTIQGLSAVTINANSSTGTSARLFTLASGATLTLGENITLSRSPSSFRATTPLITVTDGTLNMLAGSRITGFNTSSANGTVYINGDNAVFNMSGGTIDNNDNYIYTDPARYISSGGVTIANGKFNMTGGRIIDNTATTSAAITPGADVTLFGRAETSFTISNDASVGALIFSTGAAGPMPNFIIGSSWIGIVGALNLRAGDTAMTSQTYYNNERIVTGVNSSNRFQITLGEFRGYGVADNLRGPIATLFSLSATGVLVYSSP